MTENKIPKDVIGIKPELDQKDYACDLQLKLLQRALNCTDDYIQEVNSRINIANLQEVLTTLWLARDILTTCTAYIKSLHYTVHIGAMVACIFNEIDEFLRDPNYPHKRVSNLAKDLPKK